jgi:hypothetical protein
MKRYSLLFLIVISVQVCSAQQYGLGKGLIYLYAGMTSANVNTHADFKISDEILHYYPDINTSVDLEDDLAFPESSGLFYIKGIVGKRIQLAATYFRLHRSGGSRLTKTFAFGEHTYTVSAPVSGYLNTHYYSASVRFSIIYTPIVTAGLSLGARYLTMDAGIKADSLGYVFEKNGSLNVPVAVPGIHASVYAIKSLLIRGSLEYFTLRVKGTKGTVLETQLTAEYYLLKYLGVGVGYSITHFDAIDLPDNDIYLKDINYKVDGLNVFAAFRF